MRMSCLVLLLVSAAAFAGCTERGLDHRAASGRVEIAPVWAGLNRPSAAGYRFYGADNKPAPVEGAVAEASVDSFSVVLPEGRYSCLAYNTDAQGVTFTGLDNRLLAEVRLSSEAQPGNVYSWSVEEVEVTSRGDVRGVGEVCVAYMQAYHRPVCAKGLSRQHQGVELQGGGAVFQQAHVLAVLLVLEVVDGGASVGLYGEGGGSRFQMYGDLGLQLLGGHAFTRQQFYA